MDLILLLGVIFFALFFTYTNGFHDTANAIATVVGTKVLTPRQAIMLAAVTNLFGAFFGIAVAKTISSGLVEAEFVTQGALVCALIAAILWNLLTWWFGLPSSSSHALIGSLVGSALAVCVLMTDKLPADPATGQKPSIWRAVQFKVEKEKTVTKLDPAPASPELVAALGEKIKVNGTHTVELAGQKVQAVAFNGRAARVVTEQKIDKAGLYHKVLVPTVLSPIFGFAAGFTVMAILYFLLRNWRPNTVNHLFGKLQIASSAYMGFSHGMNDATKCMGIITLALVAATKGHYFDDLPQMWHFLSTPAGSDPLSLSLGDRMVSWLPNFLQFGYMPAPVDVKSQGVPDWVVVVCALTMALGTAVGGWKIIKTLGHKMVKLQPVHGFAAEFTAATVLAVAGSHGMPISTTHAITTSIMGVGCAKRFNALKLKVVKRIVWAWVLTIPATTAVSFGLVWLAHVSGILQLPVLK